jgi:hypothetical protein
MRSEGIPGRMISLELPGIGLRELGYKIPPLTLLSSSSLNFMSFGRSLILILLITSSDDEF